jgi:hypothetical protein
MASIITSQDFEDVKRDIEDTGKAVNTDAVITPRYGDVFKSIPMVSREAQEGFVAQQSELTQAINIALAAGAGASGWTASLVTDASGDNQQQINNRGGALWYNKAGGYSVNDRVILANGDVVKSTISNNTNNPNVDMSGWVKANSAGQIFDSNGLSQQEINDQYKARISKTFYAVDYGLKTTNTAYENTLALQSLSVAVNANNGGHVIFPAGTHEIGHQVLAGNETSGASWIFSELFHVHDCSDALLLEFNQTVFKFKDGMRHGAFDPITGEPVANGGINPKYQAGYGRAIELRDNQNLRIIGQMRIDGNDANAIVGGLYGDAGRQCVSYALYMVGNKVVTSDGSFVLHNMPLDGLYNSGLNQADSMHNLSGIVSLRNGRQAFSLTGGWNQTYSNCYFGKTGMGSFPSSPPAANLDTEAEITLEIKNINFNFCVFSDAVGASVVTEFPSVRGVLFNYCVIENSVNIAVYCKSEWGFNHCYIGGKVEPFYSTNKNSPAWMDTCTISMRMQDGRLAYRQGYMFSDGGSNAVFTRIKDLILDYDFDIANETKILYLGSSGKHKNITFNVKGNPDNVAGANIVALVGNAKIDGFMVNDSSQYSGALPNIRKSIEGVGLGYLTNAFISKNGNGDENILWANPFYSAGGRSGWWSGGYFDKQGSLLEPKELSIAKNRFGSSDYYGGGQVVTSNNGVPTSGWYRYGTIIFNANPAVGQPAGWICTTEGEVGAGAVFAKLPNLASI